MTTEAEEPAGSAASADSEGAERAEESDAAGRTPQDGASAGEVSAAAEEAGPAAESAAPEASGDGAQAAPEVAADEEPRAERSTESAGIPRQQSARAAADSESGESTRQ